VNCVLETHPLIVLGASLSLVGLTIAVSAILQLGFERQIVWHR
jgi:hypothetical protein